MRKVMIPTALLLAVLTIAGCKFPGRMIRNVTLGAPVCITRRPKSRMAPALSPRPVQDMGETFDIMRQPRDAQQHGSCGPLWCPWSIGTGPSTLEGRREAAVHEYLYGMDRRPRNHEAAHAPDWHT
jgi:hypothetical protein